MTVATGQEETTEASRPVQKLEAQPSEAWGAARLGELVGGKYRILRFLAEGGMGVVYEAQHEIVKRRFAVKFLRPDFARKRENLGRFQREAEAAGGLESEHIASVVDFGIAADGSPYIVMECLAGESLASLLRREGRLPYRRAADLCVQACHGAEAAHASGIVHRDLKPQNMFVCRREDGTDLLKILDFGIAKLEPIKQAGVSTQTGAVLGTPAYMSPEQARGERTIDLRTDVYSLGAILFQMLSGELPHPGDSPNAVLYHISSQPAVSLAALAPDLPRPLIDMVDGALATDPGARPQSAKGFAAGLARFAKREVWPEPTEGPTPPSVSEVEMAATTPASPPGAEAGVVDDVHGWRPSRYPGWARLTVLGAAAAVVAVVVAVVLSGRSAPSVLESAGAPLPAFRKDIAVKAEEPLPAFKTGAIPEPPVGSIPATSPAKTLASQPERSGGRPPGRSLGRSAGRSIGLAGERRSGTAAETTPVGHPSGDSSDGSAAAKHAFPRAAFDPNNPYGSHER